MRANSLARRLTTVVRSKNRLTRIVSFFMVLSFKRRITALASWTFSKKFVVRCVSGEVVARSTMMAQIDGQEFDCVEEAMERGYAQIRAANLIRDPRKALAAVAFSTAADTIVSAVKQGKRVPDDALESAVRSALSEHRQSLRGQLTRLRDELNSNWAAMYEMFNEVDFVEFDLVPPPEVPAPNSRCRLNGWQPEIAPLMMASVAQWAVMWMLRENFGTTLETYIQQCERMLGNWYQGQIDRMARVFDQSMRRFRQPIAFPTGQTAHGTFAAGNHASTEAA